MGFFFLKKKNIIIYGTGNRALNIKHSFISCDIREFCGPASNMEDKCGSLQVTSQPTGWGIFLTYMLCVIYSSNRLSQ